MNPTLDALQAALAAEHAAVYGYGALGARLSGSAQESARTTLDAHRVRRDQLAAYVSALKAQPVAASAAYKLPAVTSARSAAQLAAALEDRVMVGYLGLAGADDPKLRRFAALGMQEATTRAIRWRSTAGIPAPLSAFPGMSREALAPRPAQ